MVPAPDDIWGIYRDDMVTHYDGTSWSTYTLRGPSGTAIESVVAWTTSPSPIPADSSVSIGSAASSLSHVWLFGTDDTTGEPMILGRS